MLPLPPSGLLGFGCWWWVYWLVVATAEIVAGIEEDAIDTLHGCWGSWIVSKDIDFWTVTMLLEADIGGCGGIGSVGRAAIAIPACDSWLFIDAGTTVVTDDEHGNAEEDDKLETEDIGTINELVDDVDVFWPSGLVIAAAEVVE